MPRRMPKELILYKLKQRFIKCNKGRTEHFRDIMYDDDLAERFDDLDLEDELDFPCSYQDALWDCYHIFPQYRWFYDEESGNVVDGEVDVVILKLKLYIQKTRNGEEYGYVKAQIPKKVFDACKEWLPKTFVIEYPVDRPSRNIRGEATASNEE